MKLYTRIQNSLVLTLTAASMLFVACTEEEPQTIDQRQIYTPPTQQALLSGTVANTDGSRVQGALVSLAGTADQVLTDSRGQFELFVDYGSYELSLTHGDYLSSNRSVELGSDDLDLDVVLMPVGLQGEFDNAQGALLEQEAARLSLPADAFVDSAAQTVKGDVEYQLTYIDPNDFDEMMSVAALGDIEMYGIVDAEFYADGQLVNLASGATAEIEIAVDGIDAELTELSWYYYDEAAAQWVEDGTAEVVHTEDGDFIVGQVSHFTKWGAGNEKKVDICHIPPGNPLNAHTINISVNAAETHVLQHGDYLGTCEELFDIIDDCDDTGVENSDSRRLINVMRSLYILRIIFGEWSGDYHHPSPDEDMIDFCDDADHDDYDEYLDGVDDTIFDDEDPGNGNGNGNGNGECEPTGTEVCDGVDNDCDGIVDNEDQVCGTGTFCVEMEDFYTCIGV